MDDNQLLEIVSQIIENVFEKKPGSVSKSDSNKSISNWDSLNQIKLVLAIEEEFDWELEPEEMAEMTSVEKILTIIQQRQGK